MKIFGFLLICLLLNFQAQAIFGGLETENSELITKSVASFTASKMVSSAVIIGPRLLLTAAHNSISENTLVNFGKNISSSSNATRKILKVVRHPSFTIADSISGQITGLDLALVLLDDEIPLGFQKANLILDESAENLPAQLLIAGFGMTDIRKPAWPSRLKKTSLSVDREDLQFIFLQQNSAITGACSGDSGGPAYMILNNKVIVWGILHASTGHCHGLSLYTKLSIAKDWIQSTAKLLDSNFN